MFWLVSNDESDESIINSTSSDCTVWCALKPRCGSAESLRQSGKTVCVCVWELVDEEDEKSKTRSSCSTQSPQTLCGFANREIQRKII